MSFAWWMHEDQHARLNEIDHRALFLNGEPFDELRAGSLPGYTKIFAF